MALHVPYFRINISDKRAACTDPLQCKGKRVPVFRIRCQLKYLDYVKVYVLVFFKNRYLVVTIHIACSSQSGRIYSLRK